MSDKVTKLSAKYLKYLKRNLFVIGLWPTVCIFTKKQTPSQIFSRALLRLSKLQLCRVGLWWMLLLLNKARTVTGFKSLQVNHFTSRCQNCFFEQNFQKRFKTEITMIITNEFHILKIF